MRNRQRLQSHHVEEAERRHVDPDTDRQNRHGYQCETGRPGHYADCVAQVLTETVDPGPTPGIPCLLAQLQHVAEVIAAFAGGHFAMELHVILQFAV